ncbi:MAG: circadian clock protein KaiC [Rhodothermales bacterium]|nr:circadian clock protein KaiC [Rhodothermales bacterium]
MSGPQAAARVAKLRTGIPGIDFLTHGGLPEGRTCVVSGTAGSGKTILALHFLAAGIAEGQPGVFVTFEEPAEDLRRNVGSFGWDLAAWERGGRLAIIDATPDPATEEALAVGDYDLGGLVSRIAHAAGRVGARRIALDSLGSLFAQFTDHGIVRREIRRILSSLRPLGLTGLATSERVAEYGAVGRFGVEEFVADGVIILRNTLTEMRRRRTVEVLKMRGSAHAKGEHPFIILDGVGVEVIPLSALRLDPPASDVRRPTGIPELDAMCGGGFFENSIVIVSGATGTGKTLLATYFLGALPDEGPALMVAYEEGREQITRNARNWGLDLGPLLTSGQLRIECRYPEAAGLEDHLVHIKQLVDAHTPSRLVIDSLSALERIASDKSFREFAIDLTAFLKQHSVLTLLTTTTPTLTGGASLTNTHISTIADGIILLRHVELYGELQRGLAVLKMRGSDVDRRIREIIVSGEGLRIGEPIRNVAGVLSGNLTYILDDQSGFTRMAPRGPAEGGDGHPS